MNSLVLKVFSKQYTNSTGTKTSDLKMGSHVTQSPLYGKGNQYLYKEALYILRKDFIDYISDSRLVSGIYVELKNENQEHK